MEFDSLPMDPLTYRSEEVPPELLSPFMVLSNQSPYC
uniref:Down syndrome critical region protein 3 homolog isoform X2 n=1 Tax=Rhizophora mucronata TaxID=61149 RepID=A0A2P2JXS4_RHIMU